MVSFLSDDIITTDKFLSLSSNEIIYLKTDLFKSDQTNINWRGEIHSIKSGKIWLSGHSDYEIDEDIFNKYKDKCNIWFTINKNYEHKSLYSLPLGVTNNTTETNLHPIYGNIDIMIDKMSQPRNIINLVYMNFDIANFPSERQNCYNNFKDKQWVTIGNIDNTLGGRSKFLENIRNHKFVLCPRGNGIDTHRLWETLYMGSIPIVINEVALNEFKDLPILFIDNWGVISEEFLNKKYDVIVSQNWNFHKLKFGYWKDKIINSIDNYNIPKTIYQTWKTKNLHPKIEEIRRRILNINPGYMFDLFDDIEIDNFINRHFDERTYDAFSKLNVGAARADFWRYCVLYINGGVYLDIDSEIIKPLKNLINEDDQCIITREGNPGVFNNWVMIFERNHPILKEAIERCIFNVNNKTSSNIGHLTGPAGPFTQAINTIMCQYYKKTTNLYYESDDELNIMLNSDKISVRAKFFRVDLDDFARWKHSATDELYYGSLHWLEEKNIYRD